MTILSGEYSRLRAFRTRDVDCAREHMAGVFRSHALQPVGTDALAMSHESLKLGQVSVHWLRYGSEITMRAPEMDSFYLFQFIVSGGCEVRHGRNLATVKGGQSYAIDPAQPLSKRWARDCEQVIIRIDRDHLAGFAEKETGVDSRGRLWFEFAPLQINPRQLTLLQVLQALHEENVAASGMQHPRVTPYLDGALKALVLANFPHSLQEEYDRAGKACAPYYVFRVEQFIRANARDLVETEKLAEVAGVSTRSLFAGFRRFRGTTPMAYLKSVRLDLAKSDLIEADPSCTTVTDVAVGCGFTHMSKFARDFKRRFGVAPSTILSSSARSQY